MNNNPFQNMRPPQQQAPQAQQQAPQAQQYAPQPQQQAPQYAPQPPMQAYDPFADIAGAQATLRPDYCDPGRYLVEINELVLVQSTRDNQPVWGINFTILESDQAHTQPGSQRCQAIKPHPKAPTAWKQDLKTFMLVVLRELQQPTELAADRNTYERAFAGDGTALAGLKLRLECTQKPGKEFTRYRWLNTWEGPPIAAPAPQAPAPQAPAAPAAGIFAPPNNVDIPF